MRRFHGAAFTSTTGRNSIYLGLDSVDAERVGAPAVLEPGTVASLGAGRPAFVVGKRRRRG